MSQKIMFHMKHIIPVIVVLTLVIVPISASYLNVEDYGLFNINAGRYTTGQSLNGAPSTTFSARWKIGGLSQDVTYDMWIQLSFDRPIADREIELQSAHRSYYNLTAEKFDYNFTASNSGWKNFTNPIGIIEYVSDKSVKIHMYYNGSTGVYNPVMAFAQEFKLQPKSSLTLTGQGVACYYDTGGSDYQAILEAINNNVENLPQAIKNILQDQNLIEKQEATTAGEDAIQQGKDALEGILDINSLKDAITPLITACSYDGVESTWTFPRIKLPAIQGIMEETSLNDEIQINMTAYAEQYIPPVLLTLIRSLLTAGLIVYAIREVIIIVNNVIPS